MSTNPEIDRIKTQIWMLKQSNLQRSDMIDRCRSEKHKALIRSNMELDEAQIERLQMKLKEMEEC